LRLGDELNGMAKKTGDGDRIRRNIERKRKARLRSTGPYRKASLIHKRQGSKARSPSEDKR